jgi:hypothetical protein
MKREKKLWLIILAIYTLITAYFAYPLFMDFPSACGIVLDKKQPNVMHLGKHSGRIYIENELVVNFNGSVRSVSVDDNTFYSFNKGERVCFNRSYKDYHEGRSILGSIMLYGLGMIIFLIILYFLIELYTNHIYGK